MKELNILLIGGGGYIGNVVGEFFLKKNYYITIFDNFIKDFADAGADIITFHPEATPNINKTIKLIRDQNKKVGISLKPKSKINLIESY